MYLAYMDESGNTGRRADPDQPFHLIGCLVVEDRNVRALEDKLLSIANERFPNEAQRVGFEFHGSELFGGSGDFTGIAPAQRVAACIEIAEACSEYAAAFGWGAVDKLKSAANEHPHRIAFQFIVERLEPWLSSKDSFGLLIADEQQEVEADLFADIIHAKRHGTFWGFRTIRITRIIDSVHFVKSHNSPIIQACDVITYFQLKRMYQRRELDRLFNESGSDNREHWMKKNMSRSQQGVKDICAAFSDIEIFRAKLWPK